MRLRSLAWLCSCAALLGCGDEDRLKITLVPTPGNPLAAAASVEVFVYGSDPNASPLAEASFAAEGRGSSGSLSGLIPYNTPVHVVARGLSAGGDVVARGGSRERESPGSGEPFEISTFIAATQTFYSTVDAVTKIPTGLDSGLPGLSATRLSDGLVLVAGGTEVDELGNLTGISSTAYLFDPDSGAYRTLSARLANPRAYHSATALRGRPSTVLLCGGLTMVNGQVVSAQTCEIFDPATESFHAAAGPMSKARVGHSAVLLPDTRVLLVGGAEVVKVTLPCTAGCGRDDLVLGVVHDSAEVFDPAVSSLALLPQGMAQKRAFHLALRANKNGRVLIAGGEDDGGNTLATTEIFTPDSNTFVAGPTMDTPRTHHAAARLPNDDVCIFGGLSDVRTPSSALATFECFNVPDLGGGSKTAAQPMFAPRRDHCAVALSTGVVLLVGGFDPGSNSLATAELDTPGTGAIPTVMPPAAGRAYHACTSIGSGGANSWEAVLAVGGIDARAGVITGQRGGEIYTP